jgi:hypothetical protein
VREPGEVLREKVFTVRVKVVVWTRLPDVPVTVTVALPPAAADVAVKFRVLVPEPLGTGFVLNVPVTPDGRPLTESVTADVNPVVGVMVMVLVAVPPAVIVVDEVADIEKSGATVRVTGDDCASEPLVAVN